jgi:hypothetical protein
MNDRDESGDGAQRKESVICSKILNTSEKRQENTQLEEPFLLGYIT